ncbi:uncharacterized protein DNG_02770 [Cephalotrichum gorgonifer]|uniref:CN hydrolase domain-containing protein n=1 Tax=Cephalotrichum gorgonifer TaxID=2041049 RepID=A0AAE8MUT3_9PEZI|nr:uncharacterized protein DNG_02770 [Cephalotrichum gorgonifer]
MKIGCLQFSPVKGDVNNNLSRADAVLLRENPDYLDLLVLPELAFSGSNFKSLQDIYPHLEPTGSGISSLWARTVALKYGCTVIAGYPEKVDVSLKWPASPEYYNSAIIINDEGETAGGYRKSHLYGADEAWALEGQDGFFCGEVAGYKETTLGISMDITPYRFQAPWISFEFAFHILNVRSNLVIVSMAWPTNHEASLFNCEPQEPDMESLMYWLSRLEPLIHNENGEETIVVFANRAGSDEEVVYAGTSAVVGIRDGEVSVYGILGRCDQGLLVVDTDEEPYGKLVYRPEGSVLVDNMQQTFYNMEGVEEPSTQAAPSRSQHQSPPSRPKPQSPPSRSQPPPPPPPPPPPHPASPPAMAKKASRPATTAAPTPSEPSTRPVVSGVGSSKRRDTPKLSLQTGPEIHDVTYPNIPTPTGPSPTPISRRPRFSIQPAESLTQRYIDSSEYTHTPHPMHYTPVASRRILGGEVLIAQSASSGVDNGPIKPWDRSAPGRGDTSPTNTDSTDFTGISSTLTGSVTGAYRKMDTHRGSNINTRLPTFPEDEEPQEVMLKATSLDQLAANYAKLKEEGLRKKRGQIPRGEGQRQESEPDGRQDMAGIISRLGKVALDQQQRRKDSIPGPSSDTRASPPRDQRVAVLSKSTQPKSSALEDLRKGEASGSSHRGVRSDSRGRGGSVPGRTSPTSGRTPPRSKGRASAPIDPDREQSRGRPRQTKEDVAAAARAAQPKPSSRSEKRSRSAQSGQPIDLSQFQVIEERPHQECPVHGSRSNSRSQDQPMMRPSAPSQQGFRPGSARGQRSNRSNSNAAPQRSNRTNPNATTQRSNTPNPGATSPQQTQSEVRNTNLVDAGINSDMSRPGALMPRPTADVQGRSAGTRTAPRELAQYGLRGERSRTAEPAPTLPCHLLPRRYTPGIEPSTPAAMFVVFDSDRSAQIAFSTRQEGRPRAEDH